MIPIAFQGKAAYVNPVFGEICIDDDMCRNPSAGFAFHRGEPVFIWRSR